METLAVFAIAATVLLSFIYFLLLEKLRTAKTNHNPSMLVNLYILRKVSGFLLFGVLPVLAVWVIFQKDPVQLGLTVGESWKFWPWMAGVAAVLLILNSINSKSSDIQAVYPEMQIRDWSLPALLIASGGWILYLAGYEFLFRGLLLFSCYEAFGLWPAVVINIALYASLHLQKSMKEALGTIPFGALVCYLTIESGSILPAILLHSFQAICTEMFCIYRNPQMRLIF